MPSKEIIEAIGQLAAADESKVESDEGLLASSKDQNFGAIFGRDAAIRIIFRLSDNSQDGQQVAKIRKTLITLAQYQGQTIDPLRDEEPGKIPHELRFEDGPKNEEVLTKLKSANWPVENINGHRFLRYYGSADSTPLFVIASSHYLKATNNADFPLFKDNLEKAINWIINFGDADHDLYIEFQAANRQALLNQGWKDSNNSIQTITGERPKEPIALVEIQGYEYWALQEAAWLFEHNGNTSKAASLQRRAGQLKEKFNQDFWMADEGFFAYALDGNKHQIKDITSNVGHLLLTGIIAEDKVPLVVERLTKPDLLTPYGIRTLSTNSSYYSQESPTAYHNGAVWPHDNAIIFLGLKKLGFVKEAEVIRTATVKAQLILKNKYNLQNVEVYSVDKENNLTPYSGAQAPQGWVVDANKHVFTQTLETN